MSMWRYKKAQDAALGLAPRDVSRPSKEPPQYDEIAGVPGRSRSLRVQEQFQYDPHFEKREIRQQHWKLAAFPRSVVVFMFKLSTNVTSLDHLRDLLIGHADTMLRYQTSHTHDSSDLLESFKMYEGSIQDAPPERAHELYVGSKDVHSLGIKGLRKELEEGDKVLVLRFLKGVNGDMQPFQMSG